MTSKNKKRRMRSKGINIENKRKYWRTFSFTSLALSVGCIVSCSQSTDKLSIRIYKDLAACQNDPQNTITIECEATYKAALREADRTSQKFRQEALCKLEYGECKEMPDKLGYRPKMAAFMMADVKPENFNKYNLSDQYRNVFYQPIFTSTSSYSDLYDKLFFADGKVIGSYSNMDNIQFEMNQRYLHPLETVRLPEVFQNSGKRAENTSATNSVLNINTLGNAYIASEIGHYSECKQRERMHRERLNREKEQQLETGYYGGTNVSTSTGFKGMIKTSDSKPIVTTKSKGGFGSTSSAKSSWGGWGG
ncbi:DUF1190 domain-containing protein [Photorhabdus heterorhabditis]|uniref:DUF1190 domain-containing protein n=1 Tax=Photorhabdus heterorhabditis TaxID=880156 RepID=UPI00156269FA|nr:DUF1190 domain-containing protein [Photorhabdus heterorhabditis]NRN26796.1 DUF1190 domain-containing protein [Photorhabdus heterorhabditis subsp. aluminescens]